MPIISILVLDVILSSDLVRYHVDVSMIDCERERGVIDWMRIRHKVHWDTLFQCTHF